MLLLNKIISKEDAAQIHWASIPSEKATLVSTAMIKSSPEFQDFMYAIHLSLPSDFVETMQSCHYESGKLISTFSANLNTITTVCAFN